MNRRGVWTIALAALGLAVGGVIAFVRDDEKDAPTKSFVPEASSSAEKADVAPVVTATERPKKARALRIVTPSPVIVPGPDSVRDDADVEETKVAPTGEYASIDVQGLLDSLRVINDPRDSAARAAAAARAEANPEKCAPPLLFALGRALFDAGRKEDGAFWFYAGQLRGRIDINRCADGTVRDANTVMTETYGPPINRWAFQDLDALESRVERVVAWDEKSPYDYDVRWINLHGMGAVMSGLPKREDGVAGAAAALSKPKAEWPAIEKSTRAEFLAGLKTALVGLRKQKR